MAERFFAKKVKLDYVSDFMTDLIDNKGVDKADITTTPVSGDYLIFTYYNDIPVVTLASGAVVSYEYGTDEPDWTTLVTVTDGDHSSDFVYSVNTSEVDMDTVGTFNVYVTVTDASGNLGNTLEIEITIVDTTVPVITDAETLVVSYVSGDDAPTTWLTGITATDGYDGVITDDIVVDTSAVDMDTVGTFAITYNVDDANGNSAVELSKTITITSAE